MHYAYSSGWQNIIFGVFCQIGILQGKSRSVFWGDEGLWGIFLKIGWHLLRLTRGTGVGIHVTGGTADWGVVRTSSIEYETLLVILASRIDSRLNAVDEPRCYVSAG